VTESLERIQRRLRSATDIHEIFGAMRTMAAVRLQEAQRALPGARSYADTVAAALGEVLPVETPVPPARARRPALVAFVPEHGFVGALAERLLERAIGRSDAGAVIVVGDRGADLAEERGLAVHSRLALGTHVEAAPSIARRLAGVLDTLVTEGWIDGADVLFARYTGAGGAELVERRLLPLDPRTLPAVRGDPLLNLPRVELADAILSEWVLGELVHAVVETLASENGARLLAMDAARSSVESKLVLLRGAYRIARQEAITSEIAEVVGGVLAQEPP
jgi:F-type H+-transporting ATPase subunit gamma